MRTYSNKIYEQIKGQITNSTSGTILIRLEGFETPILYRDICEKLSKASQVNVIARLSREKYEQFCMRNQPEWQKALNQLKENNWIDFDGTATKSRNESATYNHTEERNLVLLMGTEVIEDRGSLEDFYFISPQLLLDDLKKDYSLWFHELFESYGFSLTKGRGKSDEVKAINTYFKELFRYVNISLLSFSNMIDDLMQIQFINVDEVLQEISANLNKYWGIMNIEDEKLVPKVKDLKSGSIKKAQIIERNYKFITREAFSKGVTLKGLEKYTKQITEYGKANQIDATATFPMGTLLFSSYEDFAGSLLDFIQGKDYKALKSKFLQMDYAIIDQIIKIKVDKGETTTNKKDKENKVTGNPLEVYLKMLSQSVATYYVEHKQLPQDVEIKVNAIFFTNCAQDEDRNEMLKKLNIRLGGIVEYINGHIDKTEYAYDVYYTDNIDPFKAEQLETTKSRTEHKARNGLSYITYTVTATDGIDKLDIDFKYMFNEHEEWISDTLLYIKLIDYNADSSSLILPLYGQSDNLTTLLNCESDDEFYINLSKLDIKFPIVQPPHILAENLGFLLEDYKKLIEGINKSGIYYLMLCEAEQTVRKVSDRYAEIINKLTNKYDTLDSQQKKQIDKILDMFSIKDKDSSILIPPYHPVMLEKFYYKEIFLMKNYNQCIQRMMKCSDSAKDIENVINRAATLATINSAIDFYPFSDAESEYKDVNEMHGLYALYSISDAYTLLKDKTIDNQDEDNEVLNKTILTHVSDKSKIIADSIDDYIKTFPARVDGIDLLFINPDEMQHIVAGIHHAIKDTKNNISINIRIMVPRNRIGGDEYLKYWLNNCFEDKDGVRVKTYLSYVNFDGAKIHEKISKLVDRVDIAYLYNVFKYKGIGFDMISKVSKVADVKYPSIFCPIPASLTEDTRRIDISQRQFETVNAYTQLAHKFVKPNDKEGQYRVIKKLEIEQKSRDMIDFMHEKSRWVVCMDQSIDKDVINTSEQKIIGFSTGKGMFGELNSTISSQNDIIKSLEKKLKHKLLSKFSRWSVANAEEAAKNCIEISKNLDGSKLLKALNPRDYEINNYLAYVLTMQEIKMNNDDNNVVTALINLDNYTHWFRDDLTKDYENKDEKRPDFLILEVKKNEQLKDIDVPLRIKATVVECKMAYSNESHIDKAKQQLISGIEKLANKFSPNNTDVNSRYWFNQLYRAIVFSKLQVKDNDEIYPILIDKIYDIYNGKFEIEWNGKVFAYWLDSSSAELEEQAMDRPIVEGYKLNSLDIYTGGQLYVQKLLIPENMRVDVEFVYEEIVKAENDEFSKQILGIDNDDDTKAIDEEAEATRQHFEEKIFDTEVKIANTSENMPKAETPITQVEEAEVLTPPMPTDDLEINDVLDNDTTNVCEVASDVDIAAECKFLLGQSMGRRQETYIWDYKNKQLNNRHLLINGNSGSGKTYCIQTLIYEAIKNNISVIVFDYTEGFKKRQLDPILIEELGDKYQTRNVMRKKFPINPFKKGMVIYDDDDEEEVDYETPNQVANRIADAFKKAFDFGDQQYAAIFQAVLNGVNKYGDSMDLGKMKQELEELGGKTAETVVSKILPLVSYEPFETTADFSWSDIIEAHGMMYVVQLSGFPQEIKSVLTELILWDIWNYAVSYGTEATPIPVVLDEAQNISHDNNSPSGKILAEGRKFGLSGWYATQFMKGRL